MAFNQPLVIKDWQNGIAQSPHVGFGLLQNVEIDALTGAARVGKLPATAFHTAYSSNFTADAATDICTSTATVPNTATAVQFTTTGTLPAGLSTGTTYFLIKLSSTTFKVATTIANANASTPINITDAGTGTHTVTTVNPGTIQHIVRDPRTGTLFAQDSNGIVWYNAGSVYLVLKGNTLTGVAGLAGGLAIFRTSDGNATYLFSFRNASIDVVNVFGTSQVENPSWTNSWQSMNSGAGSGNSHAAIVGQDNIIYFPDDRYVGSIQEKAGSVFDPTNAATYTYNNQALTLPLGSLSYWLEQLGVNLLISVSNDSYVYPWDRNSISYGLPLPVAEYGINKMKNIGNVVYILAGTRGNIYWTQGTYIKPLTTIPLYLTNTSSATTPIPNPVTWGGIASVIGKLAVGVGASSGKSGVYLIDSEGHMTIDNYPSTGQANVTAILSINDFYSMGYSGGADTMQNSRYSSLGAVVLQSQFYRIAPKVEKAKASEIEIQIAVGVTGSIRVGYRRDLSSAFTTITTFSTSSSATSYAYDCGIIDIENIQFQIEMSGNIDLLEMRVNP